MPVSLSLLRSSPDLLRASESRRFRDPASVDRAIALDRAHRASLTKLEGLRASLRETSAAIGAARRSSSSSAVASLTARSASISSSIRTLSSETGDLFASLSASLRVIGNPVSARTPTSRSEADNALLFSPPKPPPPPSPSPLPHHEILSRLNGSSSASSVSGRRFHYLLGGAMLLNRALLRYGLDFLVSRGYVPVQPPYILRGEIMEGVAQRADFDETLYALKGGDGYLIATSEQPLSALHRNETLASLPLKYAGVSPCFRREAGSRADFRGLFRVHQFDKVEQFVLCRPEESPSRLGDLVTVSRAFYDSLGLSYRAVRVVSGALSLAASEKVDLEAWFPGSGSWRELVSASNCGDYVSRAMGVRYEMDDDDEEGGATKKKKKRAFVHMLNATLVASQRTLCCVLENYQTARGVRIPKVLVPYMGGREWLDYDDV